MRPRLIFLSIILSTLTFLTVTISYAAEYTFTKNDGITAEFDEPYTINWVTDTIRISVNSAGNQSDNGSGSPNISGNGHYVAFSSAASNLVANDTNGVNDVFVYDQQTKETARISVASDGTQGNGLSSNPRISADGRYIVFSSRANNLVAGDTNNNDDIFVHDQDTGETFGVSIDPGGTELSAGVSPAISANGRYIAYLKGLFPYSNIYLRDLQS